MYARDKILVSGLEYYRSTNDFDVSVVELSKALSISKVTLYNHFGSKMEYNASIVAYIIDKVTSRLENLSTSKVGIYKKIVTFIEILTTLYISSDYAVVEGLRNNQMVKERLLEFDLLYKSILLGLVEEGQRKNLIFQNVDPVYFLYVVDMGLAYFKGNLQYRDRVRTDKKLSDFIMNHFTNQIFVNNDDLMSYSKDVERQKKDSVIQYYIELAQEGTKRCVDTMMKELEDSETVIETRFIDFGLSLVESEEGTQQIEWYLFNGTQIQRNYSTLYFIRQGRYDLIRKAYDLGLIDEKQAFSR